MIKSPGGHASVLPAIIMVMMIVKTASIFGLTFRMSGAGLRKPAPCQVMITTRGSYRGVWVLLPLRLFPDYLVHPVVGDRGGNGQILLKNRRQLLHGHEAVGDVAGRAVVVGVDLLPAHAVGHSQRSAGLEQAGERSDQPFRIGKVRKGVIDHDTVKLFSKICGLHVPAEDRDLRLRKLCPGNLRHLRGYVNAGDGGGVTFQIVRDQHAGAAGYVLSLFLSLSFFLIISLPLSISLSLRCLGLSSFKLSFILILLLRANFFFIELDNLLVELIRPYLL